jgi:toxin YoeB
MNISFSSRAWEHYLYFQQKDKKITKKINFLIKDILRDPFTGIGKPEQLKHELSTFYSRKITNEHRLVYRIENDIIIIISCKYHYEK